MSIQAERRHTLLAASMATLVVALAIALLRGDSGDDHGAGLVLSTPALPAEAVEGDADARLVIPRPRSTASVALEESSAAPVTQPEPRLVAASWMAARNSAHVVTPEQRLKELVGYREQLAATTNDSFLRHQTMHALAAVAAATHLDELGQATITSVQPTELQWEFATGGAMYLFERGKYPAYDSAREAFEAAAAMAGAHPLGFAAGEVPPIPAETLGRLDEFVTNAVLLLTRTE